MAKMSKGKPRKHPEKRQNRWGDKCWYFEELSQTCELLVADTKICKGNRHNCVKIKYKILATRSNRQKE